MFWGVIMAHALKILKNERISGGALILMAAALWSMYAWADRAHTALNESSIARHQNNIDTMVSKQEFNALQKTVELGFESIVIDEASAVIRDIKFSRQLAQSTKASINEIAGIDEKLQQAKDYKDCLVGREHNCEKLRVDG